MRAMMIIGTGIRQDGQHAILEFMQDVYVDATKLFPRSHLLLPQ